MISLAVGDPGGFLDVLVVIDLQFSVSGRALVLQRLLVVSVSEFEGSALGTTAAVGRVHDEKKLGFLSAVLGVIFKIVDGVSVKKRVKRMSDKRFRIYWYLPGLVSGHGSLEVIKSGISFTLGFKSNLANILVHSQDHVSGLSASNIGESSNNVVVNREGHIYAKISLNKNYKSPAYLSYISICI